MANILGNTVVVAPAGKRNRKSYTILERSSLTRRQRQVLELTSLGFTNAEIATTLGLSRRAVSYHLTQLRRRLHAGVEMDPVSARILLEEEAHPGG